MENITVALLTLVLGVFVLAVFLMARNYFRDSNRAYAFSEWAVILFVLIVLVFLVVFLS
jgi:hypothetical protein